MSKSIAILGVALLGLVLAVPAMADGGMCGTGHGLQTVSTPQMPIPVATTAPVVSPGG